MAKSTSLFFTKGVNLKAVTILPADTTTLKTIYAASADDAIVKAINVVSDDTAARVLDLVVNDGTTDYLLGSVNIPLASGSNGTATAVDLLSGAIIVGLPYDALSKRVLPLKGGYVLKVRSQSTVTTAKTITVTAVIEEY